MNLVKKKENDNNKKKSLIIKKIIKKINPNNLNIKSNINNNIINNKDCKYISNKNNNDNLHNLNNSKNKESKINDNNNLKTIIVKNVSSKDKKVNIFIKYYEWNNEKYSHNIINSSFHIISTDSITMLNTTTKIINKNNNRYLKEILSSIIEEDEKSKVNPSINNSNSAISEEDKEKHKSNNNKKCKMDKKSFRNHLIIYLTNILQNIYDDNKKTILYLFMRNFKKIQNQLYFKNSLNQYNSLINNEEKETNIYINISNNNESIMIKSNGRNEAELSNEKTYKQKNNINKKQFFYTIDNSLYSRINNQKNILIGSILFKDFEIKDDDYNCIKPKKKSFSSNSINQIKKNGSIKNLYINEKKFEKIIIQINNKKNINYYFKYWKSIKNINKYNDNGNKNFDNGMNNEDIEKGNKYINNNENGVRSDDFNSTNIVKHVDNGIDVEYQEIKNKNIGTINKILINKKDKIHKNIYKMRNSLIKFILKK